MSRPKHTKTITISKTQLRKHDDEIVQKMIILSAAYLMDEMDYSDDRIVDYWEGLTRYAEAIDEKLITIRQVNNIIEEKTGLKLGTWK